MKEVPVDVPVDVLNKWKNAGIYQDESVRIITTKYLKLVSEKKTEEEIMEELQTLIDEQLARQQVRTEKNLTSGGKRKRTKKYKKKGGAKTKRRGRRRITRRRK